MRRQIVHEGAEQLTYEIREIVAVAQQLHELGVEITWENIGDPIEKGEKVPQWMKEIIVKLVSQDKTYGYVSTQGVYETRKFLAEAVNKSRGCRSTELWFETADHRRRFGLFRLGPIFCIQVFAQNKWPGRRLNRNTPWRNLGHYVVRYEARDRMCRPPAPTRRD